MRTYRVTQFHRPDLVEGDATRNELGSSLLVMSIIGGAVFPAIMGYISDMSNSAMLFGFPSSAISMYSISPREATVRILICRSKLGCGAFPSRTDDPQSRAS